VHVPILLLDLLNFVMESLPKCSIMPAVSSLIWTAGERES